MHELGIAMEILKVVERHLPPNENLRVKKIHLRVGKLTGIVPPMLRTCMEAVTRNTAAEGAELVFTEVPTRVKCLDCAQVSEVELPPFVCLSCGNARVDLISGRENFVESIEVEEKTHEH